MKNSERTTTYGRKVVKNAQKKSNPYTILYLICAVCILFGLVIGLLVYWGIDSYYENKSKETTMESTDIVINDPTPLEPQIISLGEYRLTAYCSCEKCCGQWANNRPLDENGNPIVYTANMSVAKQGVTVAADTSVLPFGTVILIDGHEYIVQDRGGAIKGNRIDVYFDSHEEALQFGVQYKEIFMKGEN